jgi:hypothetical protein
MTAPDPTPTIALDAHAAVAAIGWRPRPCPADDCPGRVRRERLGARRARLYCDLCSWSQILTPPESPPAPAAPRNDPPPDEPPPEDPETSPMHVRTCTVDGCDASHESRGLCATHRQRWYRCGRPDLRQWIAAGGPSSRQWARRCGAPDPAPVPPPSPGVSPSPSPERDPAPPDSTSGGATDSASGGPARHLAAEHALRALRALLREHRISLRNCSYTDAAINARPEVILARYAIGELVEAAP